MMPFVTLQVCMGSASFFMQKVKPVKSLPLNNRMVAPCVLAGGSVVASCAKVVSTDTMAHANETAPARMDFQSFMDAILLRGQGFNKDFSHLNIRAFALNADEAGTDIAAGDLVHALAIDNGFHRVTPGDDDVGVPFADGIFIRWRGHGHVDRLSIGGQHNRAGTLFPPKGAPL